MDGIVNVSRSFALRVFEEQRARDGGLLDYDWKEKLTKCGLLWRLNETSSLPFRLENLIEEVAAPAQTTSAL